MRTFIYDMISAQVPIHPQLDMKKLGFKVEEAEAQTITDAWRFKCSEVPEAWPDYIKEVS